MFKVGIEIDSFDIQCVLYRSNVSRATKSGYLNTILVKYPPKCHLKGIFAYPVNGISNSYLFS